MQSVNHIAPAKIMRERGRERKREKERGREGERGGERVMWILQHSYKSVGVSGGVDGRGWMVGGGGSTWQD